jgi:hypothetical protein
MRWRRAVHAGQAPPVIGASSAIDAIYDRVQAGDPQAIAMSARLIEREKSGQASTAERALLWSLRAMSEASPPGVTPSAASAAAPAVAATIQRCLAHLARARRMTSTTNPSPGSPTMYGNGPPLPPFPPNPFAPSFGATHGGGFSRGGFSRGGHGFRGGFAQGGGWGWPSYGYGYGLPYGCQYVWNPATGAYQVQCPPGYNAYGYGYGAPRLF